MSISQRLFCGIAIVCAVVEVHAASHLFVLAGQSNMVGLAPSAGCGKPDSIPGIRIWTISGSGHGAWQALRPGYGNDSASFGLELEFGATLRRILPADTFYLVKTAWHATSLQACWRSPAIGDSGACYDFMLAFVDIARASLPGPAPRIDGFFWMQGESDAQEKSSADAYGRNLRAFLADLRSTWGDSSIPVVMGLIDRQPAWPYAAEVRAAQVAVAEELDGVEYVETAGLETDGVHYKAAGLDELGRRMAQKWVDVVQLRLDKTVAEPSRKWVRVSSDIMLLWGPSQDGVQSFRLVDVDGHASAWEPCRVPLDFHRGRLRDARALFVQLRDPDGAVETLRIPRLWR
jgi:hypothetical protein